MEEGDQKGLDRRRENKQKTQNVFCKIEHDLIFFCFVILGRFAMVRA